MSNRSDSKAAIYSLPKDKSHIVLTGDRPTGPLHLGHYYGSLKRRIECQSLFKQYVVIADVQALTDHADNPQLIRSNVMEVMTDYLAVGLDPSKSTFYLQSAIPETAELTLYYMNMIKLGRLQRNPTVKTEIRQKGLDEEVPVGFLCYPLHQAADISQFRATLVPVGPDQIPMIELTNDIIRSFNKTYNTDYLVECAALVPAQGLLPGLDGDTKMSKSLNNAIYLKDDAATVAKKVKGMFTDPQHLRVEDPGRTEGNPVFAYLDAFDSRTEEVESLKKQYCHGGLGDGTVKKRLTEVLNEFLEPIRLHRKQFEADQGEVANILRKGTEVARSAIQETLSRVRASIGVFSLS